MYEGNSCKDGTILGVTFLDQLVSLEGHPITLLYFSEMSSTPHPGLNEARHTSWQAAKKRTSTIKFGVLPAIIDGKI